MPHSFKPGRTLWWQWLTVLSLDAPLVAVLWQALFAKGIGVRLPWHDPVLLGLAVWLIYALDRWLEGWRLSPEEVQTPRHLFYIRHRWPIFWFGLTAALFAAVIALTRLESREFKAGGLLLIPTLLYLFSHQLIHRHSPFRVPKEICISVIFAVGCAVAPAAHAPDRIMMLGLPVLLFGMLCFTNCALISVWEKEVDEAHGQSSLARQLQHRAGLIHALPWITGIAGAAVLLFGDSTTRAAGICVAFSGFLLVFLDWAQPRIGRLISRALVDVALMTPLIVFLFA